MKNTRRKFTAAFKAKVAIECLKERQTAQELAKKFDLHPAQLAQWKREFIANSEKAFAKENVPGNGALEKETDLLYNQIGRLKMENEWLKKKLP